MAYYHIYVEYSSKTDSKQQLDDTYEKDIVNLDSITQKFIIPFLNDEMFFVSGRVIRPGTVSIFRILKSETPLSTIVAYLNSGVPRNVFVIYTEEDALKQPNTKGLCDVTYDVVSKAKKVPVGV